MALAAARRARRPGDLVAGAQLAAADLGGRDVDVVGVRLEPVQPQEPVALRRDLEDPGDLLGGRLLEPLALALRLAPFRLGAPARLGLRLALGLGWLRLGLGLRLGGRRLAGDRAGPRSR